MSWCTSRSKNSKTETQGRVHTSAATVAVLEAEDVDIKIKDLI